jgi:hypothetical protein
VRVLVVRARLGEDMREGGERSIGLGLESAAAEFADISRNEAIGEENCYLPLFLTDYVGVGECVWEPDGYNCM